MHIKLSLRNVIFTSRFLAESSAGWPHWSVISIAEPDRRSPANLKEGWHSILRLEFDDIEAPEDSYLMFSIEQANQIIEFVEKAESSCKVDGIMVHCQAGISRSAAVAKWIAERYSLPFSNEYDDYNKHVFLTLRSASLYKGD